MFDPKTRRRAVLAAGLAAALVAGWTTTSHAGTAQVLAPSIVYADLGTEDNTLAVHAASGWVVFEDSAGVTAGSGCHQETATEAWCPEQEVDGLYLWMGSGVNHVNAATDYPTEITGLDATKNTFHGGSGPSTLVGAAGNDVLTGGNVADTIEGRGGHDYIRGGGGADSLDGEAGNDDIQGGVGADAISGGSGVDLVDYSTRVAAVKVSLGSLLVPNDGQAGEGDNVQADVEKVKTGSGDDLITAAADGAANVFHGGSGDDRLVGGGGGDELQGGIGVDRLEGGTGADSLVGDVDDDQLDGGEGLDILDGGSGDDVLNGGAGDDTLSGWLDDDMLSGGPGSDQLFGYDGVDTVTYADVNVPVLVNLADVGSDEGAVGEDDRTIGIERIIGGNAGDTLVGNDAANVIRGGGGSDTIDGRGASDQLFGEAGNDLLRSIDGAADTSDCGAGTDTGLADAIDTRVGCELPAPAPPPAPTPPPGIGPKVGITLSAARITKAGHARLRVRCPATAKTTCAGRLGLSRTVTRNQVEKRVRCGSRSFSIRAGAAAAVRVKLSKACRRALSRTGRLGLRAAATASDAVSPPRVSTRRVSIKRAK